MYPLFGGDILTAMDLVGKAIGSVNSGVLQKAKDRRLTAMEVSGKLVRSLSTLLSEKAGPAWRDLGVAVDRSEVRRRLIGLAEDLGAALPRVAAMKSSEAVAITSSNICKWLRLAFFRPADHASGRGDIFDPISAFSRSSTLIRECPR